VRDTVTFFARGYEVLHTSWAQDLFPWDTEQSSLPSILLDPLYPEGYIRNIGEAKKRYADYRDERKWLLKQEARGWMPDRPTTKEDRAWRKSFPDKITHEQIKEVIKKGKIPWDSLG
jgi:hypothetical protein